MNTHIRLVWLVLILISSSISASPQQIEALTESPSTARKALSDWKEFSSTDGGFKILFPKAPRESIGSVNVGKLVTRTYGYSVQNGTTYSVMYFDAPHAVGDPKVTGELLVGIRNFALAELKGTLLSDRAVSLDNNPGRLLKISMPKGGVARAMIIVAGHRLYLITVILAKRMNSEGETSARTISTAYLESFKLRPIDRSAEGEVDRYLRENPELAQRAFSSDSEKDSSQMLNGKALSLPRPEYPSLALGARASGTVIVKVIIDEEGRVIAAQAAGGHPLLQPNAVKAAKAARFSPTLEGDKRVKVYGKIAYNFVPR